MLNALVIDDEKKAAENLCLLLKEYCPQVNICASAHSVKEGLEQIKKHHALTDKDYTYLKIKDACFKNYMSFFESKEHLSNAIATAQLLHIVYGISYQYRFMIACGKEKLVSFQHGKFASSFREFMAACIVVDNEAKL